MKSVFSRMAAVALTMWLGFTAGTASAVPVFHSFTGSAATGYTASFDNTAVSPAFSDWFAFTLPGDTVGQGGVTAITSFASGIGVMFTSFNLWESTAGLISTNILPLPSPTAALTFIGGYVPGSYHLNVVGIKLNPDGGYSGTVSTIPAPVPEPETYAMLLAGLGLIGFTARRRKQNV